MTRTAYQRRTLTAIVPSASRRRCAPRVPALVVLHSGGYAEIYGDALDVLIVNALDVDQADEVLADEALDISFRRASGTCTIRRSWPQPEFARRARRRPSCRGV